MNNCIIKSKIFIMVYIIILKLLNHILFFNKFEKYVYVNVKISIINKNEIIISFSKKI